MGDRSQSVTENKLRPELHGSHPYRVMGNELAPLGQNVIDISQA